MRARAEDLRAAAELNRAAAENLREAVEEARRAAEVLRELAEAQRQAYSDDMKIRSEIQATTLELLEAARVLVAAQRATTKPPE
jgi:hypothetical protein